MTLSIDQQLDYPKGTLKISRVKGLNDKDVSESISLDRILDVHNNLEHALLVTYRLDEKWLLNQFQPTTTTITLVSNETYGRKNRQSENINWVTPILFNPERQLIHSKFMLLFYQSYMRFVVSTGDLTEDSWEYMPNSVFIQDFPRDGSREFRANQFSMSLAYSLHDLNIPLNVVERLNHVDFKLACVHIVTTIPNQLKDTRGNKRLRLSNMDGNMEEYGMLRLAKVIADLYGDPSTDKAGFDPDTQLLCMTASLGYLNDRWLEEIYLCANGAKPQWAGGSRYINNFDKDLVDISVAFPTQEQFEGCKNQDQCQKLILARKQLYESQYFVQNALVKCTPRFKDTLVDTKMIVARRGEDRDEGWLYMGSHNFTSAAWGKPQRDRSGLYYNNYEFGIIIPGIEFTKEPTGDQMWWRYRKVPLPFKLDFRPYQEYDEPYFSSLANK